MPMRIVASTVGTPDVTEELSGKINAIVDSVADVNADRLTYRTGPTGEPHSLAIRLVAYTSPEDGSQRWAVDYFDDNSHEIEDSGDVADAEARYEEHVRAAAKNLGFTSEGAREVFDGTDVPDAPGFQTTFMLTIVRGEQPGVLGADLGNPEGFPWLNPAHISDEVYDWFAAHGVAKDPDVWVLITLAGEPSGAVNVIASRLYTVTVGK